jgi:cyclin-dependent kinase inhibitor 2B
MSFCRVWFYAVILASICCPGAGATSNGRTGATRLVQLTSGANEVKGRSVTALLAAVGSGDETRVRALLEAGAEPDDPLAARSPLVTAITSFNPTKGRELFCNTGIVRALLRHGADPNRADPMIGSLPLEDAFAVGDLDCAKIIRNAGGRIDLPDTAYKILAGAVDAAARTRNMAVIDLAISWGIDPNTRGPDGSTALHQAVWDNSAVVSKALLSRGVNPCIRNRIPQTPLDMARNLHRSEVIDLLVRTTHCPEQEGG